jgi:putative nucleotidyltransferase with HDIG domain
VSPATLRTPRLIVRTSVATFGAVVCILVIAFVVVTMQLARRATQSVIDNLAASEVVLDAIEAHRASDLRLQAAAIVESAGVASALTPPPGSPLASHASAAAAVLQRELDRVRDRLAVDAAAVAGADNVIIVSAGARRTAWLPGDSVQIADSPQAGTERVIRRQGALFRVVTVPLWRPGVPMLSLHLATALDDVYAEELATVMHTEIAIVLDRQVPGATVSPRIREAIRAQSRNLPDTGVSVLGDERYAVRRMLTLGTARIYALESIDQAGERATRDAVLLFAVMGTGALLLGGLASVWLARGVARPIDQLSRQLRQMIDDHVYTRVLPHTGSSRELDALADTFNQMVSSLVTAEAETELAYVGAIKALAAALDCRDPYTAGHSERVSALSVLIGRQLGLPAPELEVLRLGALLHDIGKIGIRDNILTKAGSLTADEFEAIKTHPTLGAHILREVPFLGRHLPIVELHHERPDGRGYPHGLLGHATPLLARIVHVADAFDAMTSARAYRPSQSPAFAIGELWRHAGSQFDTEVVEAFVASWSSVPAIDQFHGAVGRPSGAVVPFSPTLASDAR